MLLSSTENALRQQSAQLGKQGKTRPAPSWTITRSWQRNNVGESCGWILLDKGTYKFLARKDLNVGIVSQSVWAIKEGVLICNWNDTPIHLATRHSLPFILYLTKQTDLIVRRLSVRWSNGWITSSNQMQIKYKCHHNLGTQKTFPLRHSRRRSNWMSLCSHIHPPSSRPAEISEPSRIPWGAVEAKKILPLSALNVSGTMLTIVHALSHWILTIILWSKYYYYSHFADDETAHRV